jgi:hypothetical protein
VQEGGRGKGDGGWWGCWVESDVGDEARELRGAGCRDGSGQRDQGRRVESGGWRVRGERARGWEDGASREQEKGGKSRGRGRGRGEVDVEGEKFWMSFC